MAGARHLGRRSCPAGSTARALHATWDGCKLTGSQFPGAQLRPMTSTDCDWSYTSLRGADLSGARPVRSAVPGGRPHRRRPARGRPDRRRPRPGAAAVAKLRGADLRGASMAEVNWRAFELAGVRLDLCRRSSSPRPRRPRRGMSATGGPASRRLLRLPPRLQLPRGPRTATTIASRNPVAEKPRSQPASSSGTSSRDHRPADQQGQAPKNGGSASGSHSRMPRTKRSPPPSTIANGCQRPLAKSPRGRSKPFEDEAPAGDGRRRRASRGAG